MSLAAPFRNAQWRPRAAFATLLSVVGAVVITAPNPDSREGMLRWLLYVVITGIVANCQAGFQASWLLLSSVASAVGLILALCWLVILKCPTLASHAMAGSDPISSLLMISSTDICRMDEMLRGLLFAGIFLATVLAIWLACYARPTVLSALQDWFKMPVAKAKRVEKLLHLAATSIGAVWLIVAAIAKS